VEAGELRCLMLVRDEHIHQCQQRTIEIKDRCRIENGTRSNRASCTHRRLNCRDRNLALNQHYRGNAHFMDRFRDVVRCDGGIAAWNNHDAVGTGVIHFDQRSAAGAGGARDESVVDAFG